MQAKRISKAFALSTVVGLAACGGGGEEAAPARATPLAVSNYADLAMVAVVSLGEGETVGTLLPQATTTLPNGGWAGLADADPGAVASLVVRQVTRPASNKVRAAAVIRETELCSGGGSLLITADDADNNEDLSAGDTVTIDANNCVAELGQSATNGRIVLRVNAVQLTGAGDVATGSFSLTFVGFSSAGSSLNGAVDVSLDNQFSRIQYRNVSASYQGATVAFDFTRSESRANGGVSAAGNLVVNGSSYLLSTPAVLLPGSRYFSSGTLRVADRSGGYADVVMSVTGYTVNLYLPGDAMVDASQTVSWATL